MIDRVGQVWRFGWYGEDKYSSSYIILDNRILGSVVQHLCWYESDSGPATGVTWIEEDWFCNTEYSRSARMVRVL